jgi:hypothetical protein
VIFCNQMSTDQVKEMLLKNSPRKGVTEIPFLAGLWASCLHIHKDMENKCNLSVLAHHCMCSHNSFSSEGMWMQTVSMGLGFRFRVHLIQIHILQILFPLLSLNPKPIRTRCKPEQSQWQPYFSKSAHTVKVSSCLNQTHERNAWNRKYRVPCVL